jgi:glucokinase
VSAVGAVGALDLGGTHVAAGRVELGTASVSAQRRIALSPDGARSELLAAILEAATAIADPAMRLWGFAAPGPFDYERGVCTIRGLHKLEALHGVDLRAALAGVLPAAVSISFLNDAEAFLLGEWRAGAARGHARAVAVTLGTGLGSAFAADGRIISAGGSVPPEGSLHLVPYRGCAVEDTVSRRGLLARYGAAPGVGVDVADVASRARGGDTAAREAFRHVANALGEHVAPWLRAFGATCLVVGGSIARAWDLIEPALTATLAERSAPCSAARAQRLEDAALIGAALHAARGEC